MKSEPDCVFCKIVAGDIPSTKIFEDAHALAFMDIGPIARGHVLLISKEHFTTLDAMPADAAANVLRHLPALVKAVSQATGCEGINVLQNNGSIAGQAVPHVHFHIIPRTPDGKFKFNWPAGEYGPGEMEELSQSILNHM